MRTPDGRVELDPTGRLAGRGAYVCPDTDCLITAITKGALARALQASLPPAFVAIHGSGASIAHTTEGGARGQE